MGKLLVVLAPSRFPVYILQVFPGLPDVPAVVCVMVMLKYMSYVHLTEAAFYTITAVVGAGFCFKPKNIN